MSSLFSGGERLFRLGRVVCVSTTASFRVNWADLNVERNLSRIRIPSCGGVVTHSGVNRSACAARALEVCERVISTQGDAIDAAAVMIADALAADGVVQAFGTGHSRSLAQEFTARAGGLLPVNMLSVKDLVMFGGGDPKEILDPLCERDSSLAPRILALADVQPRDVFVIASQSGGNGVIVEMASLARERGHPVIAITSLEHSQRITSRHPSGKRLFELADVVIDNCGEYGDATIPLPAVGESGVGDSGAGEFSVGEISGGATAPMSTIAGALIVQMIVTEVCGRLLAAGVRPPVLVSNNVPDSDAHNDQLWRRYGARVRPVEP